MKEQRMDDLGMDLAVYGEPDIDVDGPAPTLEGADQAERFLRQIRALEGGMDEIEALAQRETDRISEWAVERCAVLAKRAAWLATSVEQFMRAHHAAGGGVTLKLPHGTLALRPARYSIVVDDSETFVKWAGEAFPEAVTVPPQPALKPNARIVAAAIGDVLHVVDYGVGDDGKVVYQLVSEDGEVVPGLCATRSPEDRTFSIGKPSE